MDESIKSKSSIASYDNKNEYIGKNESEYICILGIGSPIKDQGHAVIEFGQKCEQKIDESLHIGGHVEEWGHGQFIVNIVDFDELPDRIEKMEKIFENADVSRDALKRGLRLRTLWDQKVNSLDRDERIAIKKEMEGITFGLF